MEELSSGLETNEGNAERTCEAAGDAINVNLCSSSSMHRVGSGGNSGEVAVLEGCAGAGEATVSCRGSQKLLSTEDATGEGGAPGKLWGIGDGDGDREGQEILAESKESVAAAWDEIEGG